MGTNTETLAPGSIDRIQDGDLLAFHGTSLLSWAIKARTRSPVSHVAFAVRLHGRVFALESKEGRGVHLYPLDVYLSDRRCRIDWYSICDTAGHVVDRQKILDAAFPLIAKEYASPMQFLRSWGRIFRRWADARGLPQDTDTERYFCSEFVLHCLRLAGYCGEGYRVAARTSPGDCTELPVFHRMGQLPQL